MRTPTTSCSCSTRTLGFESPSTACLLKFPWGGVGFYDLDARNDNPVMTKMTQTAQALGFEVSSATCWGGEVICGSSAELGSLLDFCESVQRRMEQFGVYSDRGDEFLLFAAGAAGLLPAVRRLNPYIARIWTGRYFTPCEWESKTVLHLPSEKGYAFPLAFKKIAGGSDLFENSFERLCGLRPSRRPLDIRWLAHGVLVKAKPPQATWIDERRN